MPFIPESIKVVLRRMDYGTLPAADEESRVHVFVKVPRRIVQSLGESLPTHHFLFMVPTPRAPVVGWFFEIMDNPQDPLRLDTYFNILDMVQAREFESLIHQKIVPLHFVDGADFSIVGTKGISPPPNTSKVFFEAVEQAGNIPPDQYDFDTVKLIFQCAYPVDEIATWRPDRLDGQD